MHKPTISVVIPAYNAERFLRRCLESVFAQTFKPDEIIVVDDGSKDDTANLAATMGVRVLSGPNRGVSSARNSGIRAASSEWIALLDADDLWAPEKLERQAANVSSDIVLIYTGIRIFDDFATREVRTATDAITAKKMLRYCNPIATSSCLVKRDAILQGGGFREDFDIRGCEDWELWMRLKRFGNFAALPDALTSYYVYPQSLSANPKTMLHALDHIIDTTLLVDLQGLDRYLWRQRILATQLASAGLIAREHGLDGELGLMLRSLCAWPSPLWQTRRFAMLAVSIRNAFRSGERAF